VAIDALVRKRVRAVAAAYLGCDIESTPDPAEEPITVRAGTALLSVRLLGGEQPIIRVYSPLLRNLAASATLLEELNALNAQLSFVRLFWRDDTVFAAYELLAQTIDDHEFAHACDTVADVADYYDERLLASFGGDLAFSSPDEPE
jgi:hypothetical protein